MGSMFLKSEMSYPKSAMGLSYIGEIHTASTPMSTR